MFFKKERNGIDFKDKAELLLANPTKTGYIRGKLQCVLILSFLSTHILQRMGLGGEDCVCLLSTVERGTKLLIPILGPSQLPQAVHIYDGKERLFKNIQKLF